MGAFFKNYEEEYWYFEVIIMFQKMLMAGALAVIAPRSPVQLLTGLLVCATYMMIVLKTAPYVDDGLDTLSFLSSLSLTVTLLGGLIKSLDFGQYVEGFDFDRRLGMFLILINCVPLGYVVVNDFRMVVQRWTKKSGGIKMQKQMGKKDSSTKVSPVVTKGKINNDVQTENEEKKKTNDGIKSWS
jgi:predicted neutral ceramidase superfamily lipid hydrolase